MVMSKLAMAEPIAILIFNGVFQHFTKLRFVTVESGVGWFSFMAEYMDRNWEKQRSWTDSALPEKPSCSMDPNFYGRSEVRRGGKVCIRTWQTRCSPCP